MERSPSPQSTKTYITAGFAVVLTLLALYAGLERRDLITRLVDTGLLAALGALLAIVISYKYLSDEHQNKRTRQTLGPYLDPQVIEQLILKEQPLNLSGEKREMSILFSNIRGFTSFSEKMAPGEVVEFLNRYFDKMTALIFHYRGTLDKLIGDAVMCFWGHPVETKRHATRAVLCALDMMHGVDNLRSVLVLPGGAKFEIAIGVHTGQMVVGNMGSKSRFSYTVIGDNVNLGSRLESLNKYYGTQILISDTTYHACKHLISCREVDTIQIKGESQSVTIYEPLGIRRLADNRRRTDRRGKLTSVKKIKRAYIVARYGDRRHEDRRMASERLIVKPEQQEIASMYEHALALYRAGDFDGAEIGFDQVLSMRPTDGPSKLMKGRISKCRLEYSVAGSHFDPVYKFDET